MDLQLHFSVLHRPEIHQFINQIQQAAGITVQQPDIMIVPVLLLHMLDRSHDKRQRSSEIMGNICKEAQLSLMVLFLLLHFQRIRL